MGCDTDFGNVICKENRIRSEVIRKKSAKVFQKGEIKGVVTGFDTEGVIKARAIVHIRGANTLYFIPSI